ncbi:MAG: DUF4174 domain-containing protein [Paracoccaceae bacterium]
MRLAFVLGFIAAVAAGPIAADENPLDAYLWEARPVVVFADNPKDPRYISQMADFDRRAADLQDREMILLTDTDPAAKGPLRQALRPRGFTIVLIDKDGEIMVRAPHPTKADALTRLIDRTELRQQEVRERRG